MGQDVIDSVEDTGTTPAGDDDHVPLEDASDEELEAALNSQLAEENNSDDEPTSDAKEEPAHEKPPGEQPEAEKPKTPEEQAEFYKAQNLQLQKQLSASQAWIQQRSAEIGTLRGEKNALAKRLQEVIEAKSEEDPVLAAKADRRLEQVRAEIDDLDSEAAKLTQVHQSMDVIKKYVPAEMIDLQAVAETLTEDGLPPQLVKEFVSDPYSSASADALVHLFKRAHVEKALKKIVPAFKNLMAENESLKKQLGSKGTQVLKRVQNTLKTPPTMRTQAAPVKRDPSTADIANLSDVQLEQLLEKSRREENG